MDPRSVNQAPEERDGNPPTGARRKSLAAARDLIGSVAKKLAPKVGEMRRRAAAEGENVLGATSGLEDEETAVDLVEQVYGFLFDNRETREALTEELTGLGSTQLIEAPGNSSRRRAAGLRLTEDSNVVDSKGQILAEAQNGPGGEAVVALTGLGRTLPAKTQRMVKKSVLQSILGDERRGIPQKVQALRELEELLMEDHRGPEETGQEHLLKPQKLDFSAWDRSAPRRATSATGPRTPHPGAAYGMRGSSLPRAGRHGPRDGNRGRGANRHGLFDDDIDDEYEEPRQRGGWQNRAASKGPASAIAGAIRRIRGGPPSVADESEAGNGAAFGRADVAGPAMPGPLDRFLNDPPEHAIKIPRFGTHQNIPSGVLREFRSSVGTALENMDSAQGRKKLRKILKLTSSVINGNELSPDAGYTLLKAATQGRAYEELDSAEEDGTPFTNIFLFLLSLSEDVMDASAASQKIRDLETTTPERNKSGEVVRAVARLAKIVHQDLEPALRKKAVDDDVQKFVKSFVSLHFPSLKRPIRDEVEARRQAEVDRIQDLVLVGVPVAPEPDSTLILLKAVTSLTRDVSPRKRDAPRETRRQRAQVREVAALGYRYEDGEYDAMEQDEGPDLDLDEQDLLEATEELLVSETAYQSRHPVAALGQRPGQPLRPNTQPGFGRGGGVRPQRMNQPGGGQRLQAPGPQGTRYEVCRKCLRAHATLGNLPAWAACRRYGESREAVAPGQLPLNPLFGASPSENPPSENACAVCGGHHLLDLEGRCLAKYSLRDIVTWPRKESALNQGFTEQRPVAAIEGPEISDPNGALERMNQRLQSLERDAAKRVNEY